LIHMLLEYTRAADVYPDALADDRMGFHEKPSCSKKSEGTRNGHRGMR
jgi:hypothetical protein